MIGTRACPLWASLVGRGGRIVWRAWKLSGFQNVCPRSPLCAVALGSQSCVYESRRSVTLHRRLNISLASTLSTMKLSKLVLLLLATAAAPASAGRKKTWFGKTNEANSTKLLDCFDTLDADLKAEPYATNWVGNSCGNKLFQWGAGGHDKKGRPMSDAFERCREDLITAAYDGTDWVHCQVFHPFGSRSLAWSPLGYYASLHGKRIPTQKWQQLGTSS
ncbi:hypothetical protein CERZMDRAFT_103387 [Cercospora zeae-maydis SCOH1-5]|uniref:Uncharacterized protein n=1 Tax=Cercospora zeae-maydis SCOH1-5 TaxID=717836 RepID=A0A6A6EYK3_9PEZI|nr:hypothetical protein CERZMDRAFT_103387 [Cercospora zeae-maydis SCOH1-5]